jgi:hypothetical protein
MLFLRTHSIVSNQLIAKSVQTVPGGAQVFVRVKALSLGKSFAEKSFPYGFFVHSSKERDVFRLDQPY